MEDVDEKELIENADCECKPKHTCDCDIQKSLVGNLEDNSLPPYCRVRAEERAIRHYSHAWQDQLVTRIKQNTVQVVSKS